MDDLVGQPSLAETLTEQVAQGRIPAGIEVVVVFPPGLSKRPTHDEVKMLAPVIAGRIHPDRVFGEVLWVEDDCGEDHLHVVLRDLGVKR